MNSKMFQEPKAPVKLPVTENVSSVLEAAKVSEEEITGCCFKGVFITKFDGKLLRFKKMAFENCKFISCFFDEASFTDVRLRQHYAACDISGMQSFRDESGCVQNELCQNKRYKSGGVESE